MQNIFTANAMRLGLCAFWLSWLGGMDISAADGTPDCADGTADCNQDPGDGCEVDLNSDPDHCGGCFRPCPAPKTCTQGICLRTYKAPMLLVAPIIDGRLDEYVQATPLPLGLEDQAFGSARITWDRSALYVALEIHDADLNAACIEDDTEPGSDDGLTMLLDAGFERSHSLQAGDFTFVANILGARLDAQGDFEPDPDAFDAVWEARVQMDGTANENTDSDTGYTMEIRIAWDGLPVPAPVAGVVWGLELQLNDRTASGDRLGTPWATPEENPFGRPEDWGALVFGNHDLVCVAGWIICGGTCVNLDNSRLHCGECDQPCNADKICLQGACRLDCGPGTSERDGRCGASGDTGCRHANGRLSGAWLLAGMWWIFKRRSERSEHADRGVRTFS